MGSISILTVVALAVAVNYAEAVPGYLYRSIPAFPLLRDTSINRLTRSFSKILKPTGEPASGTKEANIEKVMAVIDQGGMDPDQVSSQDPCRTHQILKSNKNRVKTLAGGTGKVDNYIKQDDAAANEKCATAGNAFRALPENYRGPCRDVKSVSCQTIDTYYTCSVIIPNKGGLFSKGISFVSLRRCAHVVMKEKALVEQEMELIRRAKSVSYSGNLGGNVQTGSVRGARTTTRLGSNLGPGTRNYGGGGGARGSFSQEIGRNSRDRSGPSNRNQKTNSFK